jgi:hypothetical protein
MSSQKKISVYKKRGELVKKQTYVVDIGAFQNVNRPKSKVMKQGVLLKEAQLDTLQVVDTFGIPDVDNSVRDVIYFIAQEAIAITIDITANTEEIDDREFLMLDDIATQGTFGALVEFLVLDAGQVDIRQNDDFIDILED